MLRLAASIFSITLAQAALASGDYPVASCKSWGGTVIAISGIGSANANMRGVVTKADIQEYCERDPGGETRQYGGKLSVAQCVKKYMGEAGGVELSTTANCQTGALTFRYGDDKPSRAIFPLAKDDDTSCASGKPPLIAQFKMLCPSSETGVPN